MDKTTTFQFDPRRPQRSHFSDDDKNDTFLVMMQESVGGYNDYKEMYMRMCRTFAETVTYLD